MTSFEFIIQSGEIGALTITNNIRDNIIRRLASIVSDNICCSQPEFCKEKATAVRKKGRKFVCSGVWLCYTNDFTHVIPRYGLFGNHKAWHRLFSFIK